jgi:hypothetical protein
MAYDLGPNDEHIQTHTELRLALPWVVFLLGVELSAWRSATPALD